MNKELDLQKDKYVEPIRGIQVETIVGETFVLQYFAVSRVQDQCCPSCQSLISSSRSSQEATAEQNLDKDDVFSPVNDRLVQVEIELAEKKLALTEAVYENQDLTRQLRRLTSLPSDSEAMNNPSSAGWLAKTVHTIKEAANGTNRAKVN